MDIRLRDGSITHDPRLDRLEYQDERSRNYAAVDLLTSGQTLRKKWYYPARWLDQGKEGACVGFAFTHELLCTPVRVKDWHLLDGNYARTNVYWEAQKIDPWDGGAYPGASPFYEGTSILAGAKILQKTGYLQEYRWAFGEEDLGLAISHLGPAVIGVNWYEGMFRPNKNFYIQPSGRLMGGHAIMVCGFNPEKNYYRLWNSWGKDWGRNGWCYITRDDMARLLNEGGDACIPVKRVKNPA